MMRLKRLATAGLLLGLLVSLAGCHSRQKTDSWATIERRQKVVIGIDDSFVPMTYREKNGQLTGFDVELAKAIFKGRDRKSVV